MFTNIFTGPSKDIEYWYKINNTRNRIGYLIDTYDEYAELWDPELNEFVIVLIENIEKT